MENLQPSSAYPMEGVSGTTIFSDDFLPLLDMLESTDESPSQGADPIAATAVVAPRRYLQDHHVVLKTRSLPTKGTRIFRDHVKDVMGRKWLEDNELAALKKLQDSYYNCKCGVAEEGVVFWVKVQDTDTTLTTQREDIRYARIKGEDVAVVRATDECLRLFLKENGRKRKKKEAPAEEITLPIPQQQQRNDSASLTTQSDLVANPSHSPPKTFALQGLEQLKERAMGLCKDWVHKSVHWAESTAKQHLVDKFEKDLEKYQSLIQAHQLCEDNDQAKHPQEVGYDRFRQEGHRTLLVDIVNRMGNRMVDWYDQDYMRRMRDLTLSFPPPPSGSAPGNGGNGRHQGGHSWNGAGTGSEPTGFGGMQGLDRGGSCSSSSGPCDSSDGSYDSGHSFSSDEDDDSYEDSESTWTSSTCDFSSSSCTSTSTDGDGSDYASIGGERSPPPAVTMIAPAYRPSEGVSQVLRDQSRSVAIEDKENVRASPLSESRNELSGLGRDTTEDRENAKRQELLHSEICSDTSAASLFVADGYTLHARGDLRGALRAYRRAQRILESALGSAHSATAKVYYEIGRVLHDQDDYNGALREYQKALVCWESSLQREPKPDIAKALYNIGNVLSAYQAANDSIEDSTRYHASMFAERRQLPCAPVCC